MRVSKLGTQHFVHAHRSDTCTPAPESAEHLLLKSIVLRAVRDTGWNGDVEVCGPDGTWRADVMATRGSLRVAFEMQLSTIPFTELAARQHAYGDDGVRGCWFYGYGALKPPPPPKTDIPVFPLGSSGENPFAALKQGMPPDQVRIGSRQMLLSQAVSALLNRQFRWCANQRVATAKGITIFQFHECWACHKDFHVFCPTECSATCDDQLPVNEFENLVASPIEGSWRAMDRPQGATICCGTSRNGFGGQLSRLALGAELQTQAFHLLLFSLWRTNRERDLRAVT